MRKLFNKKYPGKVNFPLLRRESLDDVVEGSPFKAIRSEDILNILHHLFPEPLIEIKTHCFGAFLWGVDLANHEDTFLEQKINFFIEVDKAISKYNLLPYQTLCGVYKKQMVTGNFISVTPYSNSEIRKLFCENFFSKRKIRSMIQKYRLGVFFYDFLRALKKWMREFLSY